MITQDVVDLELELRAADGAYTAEVRVERGMDSVSQTGPFPLRMDTPRLLSLAGNADQYGQALTDMVFADAGLQVALATARGMAVAQNAFLRLRLRLGYGAESLHNLRWELLCVPGLQPGRNERLSTREDILFSRYLPAQSAAPPPAPKSALRALVVISSPSDLAGYGLASIAVESEASRARAGLAGMQIEWLPGLPGERCTLNRLVERVPGPDVLYLVCHGKMIGGTGWMLLENEDGSAARVSVDDLGRRIAGSLRLPRLAVLVVCESAGGSMDELRGALAPRLVELGIPAVVAMQGALTFPSAAQFLPRLFAELQKDGVIDRAVAVARRAIIGQPDETAPVLFMSLTSGLLWAPDTAPSPDQQTPASHPHNQSSSTPPSGAPVDPLKLYQMLTSAFSIDDLEGLCFTLQVDWESIRGQTKPAKARAMIQYFSNRSRLDELAEAARQARPDYQL